MDSSRRAVESYWRSRMIDAATSDEDKVAPVYKLEEICELLRSSHVSIVKEVSEFIFKRLQHKSPVVKQKALRVIKYAVGKSGVEFRREMQRNSVAVRQLIHYKGQPDPLKGDALNKSVRETAQEALSAIFSGEDTSKPPPKESLTQRIQGFGNTNFDMPSDDKKSFLSEVVGIGSATIKQGLNSITQAQNQSKNEPGTYRSPNLRRSLTNEVSYTDSNRSSANTSGPWGQDIKTSQADTENGSASSSYSHDKSREERLLETIVTSGGVRLQPTRDAIQAFLTEATKVNALALSHALEAKLQSHMWQVRVKAICVLEAILRKKDDEHLSVVTSYFTENMDVVIKCSESPQASLREKANKVLTLLNGEQGGSTMSQPNKNLKTEKTVIQMPDLIDTNDPFENETSVTTQKDEGITSLSTSTTSLMNDFFMDGSSTDAQNQEPKSNDDPFADVAFHGQNNKDEHEATDIFSGMATQTPAGGSGPELFDIFGSSSEIGGSSKHDVNDLMAGLSINGNESLPKQNGNENGNSQTIFSDITTNPSHQSNDVLNNILKSQSSGNMMAANPMFPIDPMTYNALSSGLMFNPTAVASQQVNYGAMSSILAQQQFLSTMSNLQQMGNLQFQNMSAGNASSGTEIGGYNSALPDIFNPSIATQTPTAMTNNSKKEDTRAFDFISDHVAAARDRRRVN